MTKMEKTALLVALLTVEETAELLGVKEATVRVWMARGSWPTRSLDDRYGFRERRSKSWCVTGWCRRRSSRTKKGKGPSRRVGRPSRKDCPCRSCPNATTARKPPLRTRV